VTHFGNLDHDRERPYSDFVADRSGGVLPRLSFVVPNNCHNSHDTFRGCTVVVADDWLAQEVPAMLEAMGPSGLLILTWDEDDGSAANHILTVFVSDSVFTNFVSPRPINHYSLLRTICEALGVPPFEAAAIENPITDVWARTGPRPGAPPGGGSRSTTADPARPRVAADRRWKGPHERRKR